MGSILSLLQDRNTAKIFAVGTLCRLATQSITIPLIFSGTQHAYDFQQAGAFVGSYAFGRCVSAPLIGRLTDTSPRWMIFLTSIIHLFLVIIASLLMSAGASYYYIVGICLLAGLVFPPTSATVRAVLSSYFANHNEKASAFAVDSISLQAALIGGPLLGGSAAAFFGGTLTLVAAALVLSLSSVILTSSIPERPKGNRRSHAIALWSSLPFDALLAAIFFLALSLAAIIHETGLLGSIAWPARGKVAFWRTRPLPAERGGISR